MCATLLVYDSACDSPLTLGTCGHLTHSYIGLAITVYVYTIYDRTFGNFPAKNAVYTPYKYVYGQPYTYMHFNAG